MKTLTITMISILITLASFSQSDQYVTAMSDNLKSLAKAENSEDFQNLANQFDRIAGVETAEWLPLYYAGFCYINMSFSERDGDKTDQLLDKAQKYIDRAEEINSNEAELAILQGFLFQGRISVDPMTRGMKYAGKANDQFLEAKNIDPENPRIYYLLGMNKYNTPSMFGGGATVAQPYFSEAAEKYKSFEPLSELYPDWGEKSNKNMLEQCNKQIKNN